MIEFRFPFILYIYIPLFLVLLFWIYNSYKKPAFKKISIALRSRLFFNTSMKRVKIKDRFLFLSLFFLIFAASGPQIGVRLAPLAEKPKSIY